MNKKRILLISLILVAVAASLSIVSADSSVNVGGLDFSIPDGYIENETVAIDHENVSYQANDENITYNTSIKGFENGTGVIIVCVNEFDSPDDAKKIMDYDKKNENATTKTIKGHEGIYAKINGFPAFGYCQDNYYIAISVTDESLFESIIPK